MKTDWKDDIYEHRRLRMMNNGDGTVTPVDETKYSQVGDAFGAKELNELGAEINEVKKSVSDGKAEIAAAITLKRVTTAASATFHQMAENIKKIILGSGNAQPSDVLAGKTATNDSGVEFVGTMPERAGEQIPASQVTKSGSAVVFKSSRNGHINESSTISAAEGAVAAAAGTNGDYMLDSYNLLGVQGKIQSMGGSTVTPSTGQQTVNCAWKRMTGNIIVPGFTMPPPNAIKKGYELNIYGQTVTGEFEGYVAAAGDFYNKGAVNPEYGISIWDAPLYEDDDGNHYDAVTEFRSNTIYIRTTYNNRYSNYVFTSRPINLTPINNIHISIRGADGVTSVSTDVYFGAYEGVGYNPTTYVAGTKAYFKPYSYYSTITVNVSAITRVLYIGFWATCENFSKMEIERIWFD